MSTSALSAETPSGGAPASTARFDRHLRIDHLHADLNGRSMRGGAVTLASQGFKFVISTVQTAILAHLLLPSDFGLVMMVTAVTGFFSQFKDMGLSMATVQRPQITHAQVSVLFWVNVLVSLVATLVCAAAAPLIAAYYHERRLILITIAIGSSLLLGGLAVQHYALMIRQMRFGTLALIDAGAMAFGIALSIVMALENCGYWSLVVQAPAMALFTLVAAWMACDWRPSRPRRHCGARPLLTFGGNLFGFNFLNYGQRNVDNILVGRYWGESQLGLYSRAYSLLLLPLTNIVAPITSVALPALSRLQNDMGRYRVFYRKTMTLLTAMTMPIVVLFFVSADKVILGLMGSQWVAAIVIFRLLAPAAFVGTTNTATGAIYTSLNQNHRQLRMGVVVATLTILSFVVGLRGGARGVALAFSISVVALRLPAIIYCCHGVPIKTREVLSPLWRPALTSIAAGALLFAAQQALPHLHQPLVGFMVDSAVYLAAYALCWLIIPGGLGEISAIKRLLRDMREPSAGVAPAISGQPEPIIA